MDTSELLAQVRQRIGDVSRDRDRLHKTLDELGAELTQLEADAAALDRLQSSFVAPTEASTQPDDAPSNVSASIPASIIWPATHDASRSAKPKGLRAWAHAKLDAAAWYVETLQALETACVPADALGVEMAVDGAISSLCSAFETMICSLTRAIERVADVSKDSRTPLHLASWSKLAAASKVFDIDLASRSSISSALVGEHSDSPEGWMAQLLVLRRELTLRDLISSGDGLTPPRLLLEVPGRGEVPLVRYLIETFELCEELLEQIDHDVHDAKSGRIHLTAVDELRQRAEHGIEDLFPPGAFNTP